MGLLTEYARRERIERLLAGIPAGARILEIGCGERWVGEYLRNSGHHDYRGLDLQPPADIVGSIRDWRQLGLQAASFDTILAFEVLEHVPCYQECFDLLRPGGTLRLTTPVPHWDWACRILEAVGINQRRTSPHEHLIYVEDMPLFDVVENYRFMVIGQWAILRKPGRA
jgi:predicted SAM-dependent methyltransferase